MSVRLRHFPWTTLPHHHKSVVAPYRSGSAGVKIDCLNPGELAVNNPETVGKERKQFRQEASSHRVKGLVSQVIGAVERPA